MQIVYKLAEWSNKWKKDLGFKHFTAFYTKLRHAVYYRGTTSSLHLQVLLVNTGNVFCISKIPTSNTNGEWAFWLEYTSRECCRVHQQPHYFPVLTCGSGDQRSWEFTWQLNVISGYSGLGSYSNSKQAPSRALKHVLLAVNKSKVIEQTARLLLM